MCRKYYEKYPDCDIPPDKSFEVLLFWKWFIGHYSTPIEKFFKYAKTEIPEEWRKIQWWEVDEWLKREYNLYCVLTF